MLASLCEGTFVRLPAPLAPAPFQRARVATGKRARRPVASWGGLGEAAMDCVARGIRLVLCVLVGVALAGCAADGSVTGAAPQQTPYPPPGYSHTIQTSHVALYWNCTRAETGVVEVRGVAFNPWSNQPVRFLELELVGVASNERTLSEVATKAPAIQLFTNQSTPFELRLNPTGRESRFDLYYRYQFQDGGPERPISRVAWDGPVLLAQQMQFLVRDACSETQHRVH